MNEILTTKEKENIFMNNLINEYNSGESINSLRVNITEYLMEFYDQIRGLFDNNKLVIVKDTKFEFGGKKYDLFENRNKRVLSYQLLTKDQIEEHIKLGDYVLLYTYKFGGKMENTFPKYMVWVEKNLEV